MTHLSDDTMTHQLIRKDEAVVIDIRSGAKFQRALIGDDPAIILRHPDLNKAVIIAGPTLANVIGWLARGVRAMREAQAKQSRH